MYRNSKSNKVFSNECQYNRKMNYKKSTTEKKECNICFSLVDFTYKNTVTCNKTSQVICQDCKNKIIEIGGKCPMCRSHEIQSIFKDDEIIICTKNKDKNGAKLLNPKQKKALRRSRLGKKFYGKNNQYKKSKKLYTWKVDNKYYICSWNGSNGEYVSKGARRHNSEIFQDYDKLIQLYTGFGDSDFILFHSETGVVYEDFNPTDITLEHLGIDLHDILREIYDFSDDDEDYDDN